MANGEQKYFEKLDIQCLTIGTIKDLIKNNIKNTLACWKNGKEVEKQTFHVIGPAGVGKTAITKQIAQELTNEMGNEWKYLKIQSPVLSREDFLVPFPIKEESKSIERFKMLHSDFIPSDPESYGIYVVDEASRGDRSLQQLMWQVQNEYMIHLIDLPRGWFVVVVDNPDDAEYSVNIIEDAAGLRRGLHVYVEVNVHDFIKYAKTFGFHPYVIEFIEVHPDYLYDFKAQKKGSVYANPASWERISNLLWGFSFNGGIKNSIEEIDYLCSGLINSHMSQLFRSYLEGVITINPKEIVFDYEKVRPDIIDMVKKGDHAAISDVMKGFVTYLLHEKPEISDDKKYDIGKFLIDIPVDVAALFVTEISKLNRNTLEFAYFTKLNVFLMRNSEDYKKKFYEKLVDLGKQTVG